MYVWTSIIGMAQYESTCTWRAVSIGWLDEIVHEIELGSVVGVI